MSTIPQYQETKARLHQLELKSAHFGISADPSVSIEKEQLQSVISVFDRIDIHRRNLGYLLKQRSQYSANQVPTHILTQIRSERESVVSLRTTLQQRYKIWVPEHIVDYDVATPVKEEPVAPDRSQDSIYAKLQEIERLVAEIKELL
jgi:hypothetical protein